MSTKRDQVLFRDFGGVLHPDAMYLSRQGPALRSGGALFMWAPALVEILEQFPQVSLALSTSRVRHLDFKRAAAYLPAALGARVIGATWHCSMAKDWAEDSRWG